MRRETLTIRLINRNSFRKWMIQRSKFAVIIFVLIILLQSCFRSHPLVVNIHYEPHCSVCHGKNLEGNPALGSSLLSEHLKHGSVVDSIQKAITLGFPERGMPAFANTLSEDEIRSLAIWIGEKRANTSYSDYKVKAPLHIPEGTLASELHSFKIVEVTDDLDPYPYSMQALPDGTFLVTEKTKGLRIVYPNGELSELVSGLPEVYDDGGKDPLGLMYGLGWLLDVIVHPNYRENGWIYLSHGHRCVNCNEESRYVDGPVSMCRIIRGKIKNNEWTDQEVIWKAEMETYTSAPDITLGGRMAFDEELNLYFTVGGKKYLPEPPGNTELHVGIQDLSLPYGKIYRVKDDGSIPRENPFIDIENAIPSIWTFGHRSPQGLGYHKTNAQLWGTEMGPRGGDEINLLLAGKNYGWPVVSKGMNYDGSKVDYGRYLGINFDIEDIEQPKVDLTPSPAVSNFVVYHGDKFPGWNNNLIVGSLKAASLYRYVIEGDEIVDSEVLLKDLARIRDIEVDEDGSVFLLLEHKSGGRLVKLVPANDGI